MNEWARGGKTDSERSDRRKAVAVVQVRWTVRAETEEMGLERGWIPEMVMSYSRQTENP